MRFVLILAALLCAPVISVYAEIQQDVVERDTIGGTGGGGGGDLSTTDIDTFSELDAIVADEGLVNLNDTQIFLNKVIDGNSNTVKMLRHATDCTAYDGAVDGQYCWEQDDDLLYVCETANVCDTAGEWDAVAAAGGDITAVGNCIAGNCAIEGGTDIFPFIYEGTANTVETTFAVTDPASSDKTITFPNLTGTVALDANKLSFFAATSSSELAGVISDETGTAGKLVFDTSPTFATSALSPLWKSTATDTADNSTGVALGNNESICWELATPGTDKCLKLTSGDAFQYDGNTVVTTATDDDIPEAADYSNLSASTGILNSPTGTVIFDFGKTLAGNPAYNAEECTWTTDGSGGGGVICEGTTANTNEQLFLFPAADGADTTNFIVVNANQTTNVEGAALAVTSGVLDVQADKGVTTVNNDEVEFDFTKTLASNVALAAKGCIFTAEGGGGGFLCEGTGAANSLEQLYLFPTSDGNDTTNYIALADSSGNALAGDSATAFFSTGTIEDARLSTQVQLKKGQVIFQLRPQANEPPASSFATFNTRNSHPSLRFNGNACAVWSFVLPNTYSGNGLTVEIWQASTETTNDTDWDGSWERIGAVQDTDSDSFATAVSTDNTNNSATSGIPTRVTIAFTDGAQMDSCAAGELCRFKLCRDDTSDTGGADTIDYLGGLVRETP